MAKPETLCPNCGHSPIAAGAEACPKCGEPFAFLPMHKRAKGRPLDRLRDSVDSEPTAMGGSVTGSVFAHPAQPAAVLTLGAVIWFLRAGGVLSQLDEPKWIFAIAALDLAMALALWIGLGPAKLVAQLGGLFQLGVSVSLAQGDFAALLHLAFVGHAATVLLVVIGEPSTARRNAGLALGIVATGLAIVGLAVGTSNPKAGEVRLMSEEHGFQLQVPDGYRALSREEMLPHLHLPLATASARSFGFGNRAKRIYGALTIDRDPGSQLIGGCQEHLRVLGGTNPPVPLGSPAPGAFGSSGLVLELRTASGAVGRLSCGKLPDGRLAMLAVVAQDPDPRVGRAVFEQIGASLSIK
ncbi:MAG: zinc ribbon domain-containing protein [Myxococcales bacterium]|nr:zinc ribbon domain-containing protein [Myxococcales bacterium]